MPCLLRVFSRTYPLPLLPTPPSLMPPRLLPPPPSTRCPPPRHMRLRRRPSAMISLPRLLVAGSTPSSAKWPPTPVPVPLLRCKRTIPPPPVASQPPTKPLHMRCTPKWSPTQRPPPICKGCGCARKTHRLFAMRMRLVREPHVCCLTPTMRPPPPPPMSGRRKWRVTSTMLVASPATILTVSARHPRRRPGLAPSRRRYHRQQARPPHRCALRRCSSSPTPRRAPRSPHPPPSPPPSPMLPTQYSSRAHLSLPYAR